MFAEVKRNLDIIGDDYDEQIVDAIYAAVLDLTRTADIVLPGTVSITVNTDGSVSDNSSLTDEYAIQAIILYCKCSIGNPPNYDKLLAAYSMIKKNMSRSSAYSFNPAEGD